MTMNATQQLSMPFGDQQFHLNPHFGMPRRTAALLHWAAVVAPGTWLPYGTIAKMVLGLPHTPAPKSEYTMLVRDEVYACRPILAERYCRALLTRGDGARASVDGSEAFSFRFVSDIKKLQGTLDRIKQTRLVIDVQGFDPDKLPGYAAYLGLADREMRDHLEPSVKALVTALDHVDLESGELIVPSEETPEGETPAPELLN